MSNVACPRSNVSLAGTEELFTCCAKEAPAEPQGRASPKVPGLEDASLLTVLTQVLRGLDYSKGVRRLLPGASKLGRTPGQQEGKQGRFLWGLLFGAPAGPAQNCPYEEHCQKDADWGGVICDCCECCDNCGQPSCWVC